MPPRLSTAGATRGGEAGSYDGKKHSTPAEGCPYRCPTPPGIMEKTRPTMSAPCPLPSVPTLSPLIRFLDRLEWGEPVGFRNLGWVPLRVTAEPGSRRSCAAHDGPRWAVAGADPLADGVPWSRDPASLERLLEAFPAEPGQIGFIALVDGVVAGCELVGHPADFAPLRPALLRRYALTAAEALDGAAARLEDLRNQDARLARLAASFRQRADRLAEAYRAAVAAGSGSGDDGRALYEELRTLEAGVELFARQRRILGEELELLDDRSAADADARDPALWWSRARAFFRRAMEQAACVRVGVGRATTQRFSAAGLRGAVRLEGDEVIGLSLQARQPSRRRRGRH